MAALLVLALMAASACGSDESVALRGMVRTPAPQVGTVTLPDASTGESVAMTAADGEVLIVYFGYTMCPDICPTTMSDIRLALESLPTDLSQRVTVAMATLDPSRDTEEVLTGYLDHFFARNLALRAENDEELARATEAFGVQFDVEEHADGDSYELAHTAIAYVIDDTGTVVVEWPFGFKSNDMTSDLTTILEGE